VKLTPNEVDSDRATGNMIEAAAALVMILVNKMQPKKTITIAA
jgi:hypothetical protein